ncbi:MAG: hypothetical protein K6F93_07940 [Lachnospiraceae bacterium]|nr:hypothetical protein [Lachnospiraceae bacterium]
MNREELRKFYEENMYGVWREGEDVSFELLGPDKTPESSEKSPFFFEVRGGDLVKVNVEARGRKSSFVFHAFLPDPKKVSHPHGAPFIVCMHPIIPVDYALSKGYALLVLDTREIASDDIKREGAFYDLYPYTSDPNEQTGVLMAWAWGASKVLDAVTQGNKTVGYKDPVADKAAVGSLADILGLDPKASIVTGVSRWGKATAVCGAFDHRFRMSVPTCSGAGGLALYNHFSEGKTYDLTGVGGPKEYTYTKNEPLGCLQSDAERGWFNDRFLEYKEPKDIPIDQENLLILAMDKQRYTFVVAACMGEDWVNAPSMWECYRKADEAYKAAGLGDHLVVHFHKEGHAVLEEDMTLMIEYFDHMYFGAEMKTPMESLKTTVFA